MISPPQLAAMAHAYGVSVARLRAARRYLYGGLFWGTLAQLWLLAVLAHLAFRGCGVRGRDWLRARIGEGWRLYLVFSAGLLALLELALLPWDFGIGFLRESLYGFERLSLAGWLLDWLKSALIGIAAGALLALLFAFLARRFPRRWWLAAWALVVAFMLAGAVIEPIWIEPLFNRFTPVKNVQLRRLIRQEAVRAGVPHAAIYQVNRGRQSSHTNAYVIGLLGSQRIVVYNTLLREYPPPEVRFIVAHELGHYVLHHLWLGLAFGAAWLLPLFWLGAWIFHRAARRPRFSAPGASLPAADPAALPLLLFLLAALLWLSTPAFNGFSRWEEHQADAFALRLDPHPAAGIAAFKRFVRTDLSYPAPPPWVVWWFYNHPSLQQRVGFIARQARASGKRP